MSNKKHLKHPFWEIVDQIEEIKAYILDIKQKAKVSRTHADKHDIINPEPSFDQIFYETSDIIEACDKAQETLSEFHRQLVEAIRSSNDGDAGDNLLRVVKRTGND